MVSFQGVPLSFNLTSIAPTANTKNQPRRAHENLNRNFWMTKIASKRTSRPSAYNNRLGGTNVRPSHLPIPDGTGKKIHAVQMPVPTRKTNKALPFFLIILLAPE